MISSLRLITYNCRGWNNGSSFVADLPVPPLEAFQCAEHNCTIHCQVLESYCKSLCSTLKVSAELTLSLVMADLGI